MANGQSRMALVVAVLACAACDSGDVAGPRLAQHTLTFTTPDSVDQTGVVINEFAARLGPNESCSEFVELLNISTGERQVGGMRIDVSGPGGAPAFYATIPPGMVMGPGCHLLIATQPSGLLRDIASACNLADNGGLALIDVNGTIVDQVGMSSGTAFHEGRPLDDFDFNATGDSYARVRDTGNNVLDFVFGPATPDNQFADCVRP